RFHQAIAGARKARFSAVSGRHIRAVANAATRRIDTSLGAIECPYAMHSAWHAVRTFAPCPRLAAPFAEETAPSTSESAPRNYERTTRSMKTTICTLFAAGMLTLAGCSSPGIMGGTSTASLEPGPQTPAAKGQVSIDRKDRDPTGNNEIALEVEHLPPPSELGDEFTTFVVWITPEGAEE